jgi:hypothetical protein
MRGDIPIPMAGASCVADTALRWLVRRDWDGVQAIDVYGSEHLSFNQVARVLERVLKRPVEYREAPANEYSSRLMAAGASTDYARGEVEMFSSFVQPGLKREPPLGGSGANGLAAWAEQELLPIIESLDQRSYAEPPPFPRLDACGCPCGHGSYGFEQQTNEG